jgi:hypothetical protein
MADLRELLGLTAGLAADFYESLPERAVFPPATADVERTLAAYAGQLAAR